MKLIIVDYRCFDLFGSFDINTFSTRAVILLKIFETNRRSDRPFLLRKTKIVLKKCQRFALSFYASRLRFLFRRTFTPDRPYDACRITGELELNKVAGNFHITLGKSLSVPGGHIHLQQLFPVANANFSHRVDKFYFGDLGPGILHPLDNTLKIATNSA